MIEVIGTIAGIVFGMIAMSLSVQQHIRELRKDFERRLSEEMDRQAESKVKEYAAKRDFEHLDRHQQQLKTVVLDLQNELADVEKKLVELEIIGKGSYHRIEQVAARLDANGLTMGGSNRQQP